MSQGLALPSPHASQLPGKALIRYPRFNELHRKIEECIEETALAGEPQCMYLEGLTGVGKSTLVETYAEAFPRYFTERGTTIPVFYMETPSPVTVKGMAAAMLEELGDPGAHKGPQWSMNSRLVSFLKDCDVRLVILDDFHHLIDCETNRILEKVSDWLKVLIKRAKIPFLVVGTDGDVQRILQANKQLSRLFIREELEPFAWDINNPATIQTFAAFISYAEHTLNIQLADELPREEILYRLHWATNGVMNNMMNLLRKAARLNNGHPAITLPILAQAYDERLRAHVGKENPFTGAGIILTPLTFTPDAPDSMGKRTRRRKNQQPSIAETLTT
ncbi:MAG: TniB family NTP-binding protein [Anaerolineae bacterium]|nr:TniB family NTP-binding protein [Anaerolineae bacterium]